MRICKRVLGLCAVGALMAVTCFRANAQIALVTDRSALGATDEVNWSQFVDPASSFFSSPASFTSDKGLKGTVSDPYVPGLGVARQGVDWDGYFAANEYILFDPGLFAATLDITFAESVSAAGANIQSWMPMDFTGVLSAYDANDVVLDTVTEDWFLTAGTDSQAMFLGISDAQSRIRRIEYSIVAPVGGLSAFAINQLSIKP